MDAMIRSTLKRKMWWITENSGSWRYLSWLLMGWSEILPISSRMMNGMARVIPSYPIVFSHCPTIPRIPISWTIFLPAYLLIPFLSHYSTKVWIHTIHPNMHMVHSSQYWMSRPVLLPTQRITEELQTAMPWKKHRPTALGNRKICNLRPRDCIRAARLNPWQCLPQVPFHPFMFTLSR